MKQQNSIQRNGLRMIKRWSILAVTAMVLLLPKVTVQATPMELPTVAIEEGVTPENGFLKITEDTSAYVEPSIGVATAELKKDEQVMQIGITDTGWYQILHQGQTLYIEDSRAEKLSSDEALSQEMSELNAKRVTEAERDVELRKKILTSRIWGSVIAILIAGIFIAGIVAVLRSNEEEGEDEKPKQQPKVKDVLDEIEDISEE